MATALDRRVTLIEARRIELVVDPVACEGYGSCAELFPEFISLDYWGFPIVRRGPIPDLLMDHAKRAVNSCPKLALKLRET